MDWLVKNINHFTLPVGMFLSLLAALIGLYRQKKRREGLEQPDLPKAVNVILVLSTAAGLVLAGIYIGHAAG